MTSISVRTLTLVVALIAAVALASIVMTAFAKSGDYGVNTGGNTETSTPVPPTSAPQPTAVPPTSTPQPTTVPPTATPSGPTATPDCVDGEFGQEPNGAWVCIPYSQMTDEAQP